MKTPKGNVEANELAEEHFEFDLKRTPTAEWLVPTRDAVWTGPLAPLLNRQVSPLPKSSLRRVAAKAILISSERCNPLPKCVAEWINSVLLEGAPRDQAHHAEVQLKAAEFVARNPQASLKQIADYVGKPKSTVQSFRKQPRFQTLVRQARARIRYQMERSAMLRRGV